ncbi:LysR family transcriptional regulator, partial [Neptunomonas sp.]|uniref:LysR family transcriptional regulator n=1 Tax=Neptunomonas sp. TaxID=1971898 RepID=UPI0025F548DA
MNNKQLRYFNEVANQQSFSKAAEVLHVAQPAISMSIQKLEQELDLKLFHRG